MSKIHFLLLLAERRSLTALLTAALALLLLAGVASASSPPVVSNVVLSSSSGTNTTNDNLTASFTAFDADGDSTKNITNWYSNGSSIMVLNMPMESQLIQGNDDFEDGNYDGWIAYRYDGDDAGCSIESGSPLAGAYSVKCSHSSWGYAGIYNILSTNPEANSTLSVLTEYSGYAYMDINSGIGFRIIYYYNGVLQKKVTWRIVGADSGGDWSANQVVSSGWSSTNPNELISGIFNLSQNGPANFDSVLIESRIQNAGSGNPVQWIDNINITNSTYNYAKDHPKDYALGNNGTVYGATWNSSGGYDGKGAFIFDGNDYISLGTPSSLNFGTSSFTLTARFKTSQPSGSIMRIISNGHFGWTTGYLLALGGGSQISTALGGGGQGNSIWLNTANTFNDGAWHHVAAVYDGGSRGARVYVDGTLQSINIGPGTCGTIIGSELDYSGCGSVSASSSDTKSIGKTVAGNTEYFTGNIDDVQIYNRALSAAEITALYQNRTDLIVAQETSAGDTWQACITPNDGEEEGNTVCSNELIITSNVPQVTDVILNSAFGTNHTDENLTVYYQAYDSIKNITNWYLNGNSITVLNMPFEGGSNSTWTKDYAKGNNGTVNGATWNSTGGYDGKGAYQFAAGNNIDLGNKPEFELNKDGSVSFWIKTDMTTGSHPVMKHQSGSFNGWFFVVNDDGGGSGTNNKIGFYVSSSSNTKIATSTTSINDGQWHFVTGVYSYSNKQIKIYIDGVLENIKYETGYTTNLQPFKLGSDFTGTLDDVKIHNYTLTDAEILALYQNKTDLILAERTTVGDVWQACVTPNDGEDDGSKVCSNDLTITGGIPAVTNVGLNSTFGTNYANENLTVYYSATNSIKNITNWRRNGNSIAVLNTPFEGGSNSIWTRDYALGNNGSVSGAAWNSTGGYDGKGAYYFDGIDDYINTASNIPSSTRYTISSRVKFNAITNEFRFTEIAGTGWYNAGVTDFVLGVQEGINTLFLGMSYSNTGTETRAASSVIPVPGRWYHVAGTYDGSNLKIYIDGVLQSQAAFPGYTLTSKKLYLGGGLTANNLKVLNGSVDDVQFFNRSLSAEQIQALYQNRTDLLVEQETSYGETWQACITPNDGIQDGTTVCSDSLSVNSIGVTNVSLNSTYGTNYTNENLTLNYILINNLDKPIINWYNNGNSIMALNMPFEGGLTNRDYALGNNGSVSGATWNSTGGYDGKGAYYFDGNDLISLGNPSSLNFGTNSFTLTARIKTNQPNGSIRRIISNGNYGWTTGYHLELDALSYLSTGLGGNGQGNSLGITASAVSLNDGLWHHVAAVYDNNAKRVRLYIDGALQPSVQWGSTCGSMVGYELDYSGCNSASGSSPDTKSIGNSATGNAEYFIGNIDDVYIYNRSLSAEQIQALYQNRTDLIIEQETSAGDVWKACITPNDGTLDGNEVCSNNLTIASIAPDIEFTQPTPDNSTTTASTGAQVNVSITNASDLSEFKWSWNGTNYTFYNDSLVLRMNFDNVSTLGENAGKAVDASKYANDGTIYGAVWNSSGKYSGAYRFDGTDDYIHTNVAGFPSSFTAMAWINYTSGYTILGSYRQSANDNAQGELSLSSNQIWFTYDPGGSLQQYHTISTIPSNQWTHVAVTYTYGNGNSIKIYINGVLQSGVWSPGDGNAAEPSAGNGINIGALTAPSWPNYYNGLIDEVAIYSRALSAGEIKQHYYSNLNKYDTDKWGFYTNQSDLTAGTYNYFAYVRDNAGSENITETRYITITSSAGGAVTPVSACGTISSPGEYVLTANISNSDAAKCIEITSSNVIFDGAGHTIDGTDIPGNYGVDARSLTNITVKNLMVTDWYYGIYYENASNGYITNNNVSSGNDGIYLYSGSSSNTLSYNNASSNWVGINIAYYSNNNTLTDNTANSNEDNGIYISTTSNNTLIGNNASLNNGGGIVLSSSTDSTLTNNAAGLNGANGIRLGSSGRNTLINNNASSNGGDGIYLSQSSYNTIENSTIKNNIRGIFVESDSGGASFNNITGNNASENTDTGIYLFAEDNTTIRNNYVQDNQYGIYITDGSDPSKDNSIYNNYISGNTVSNVFDDSTGPTYWNTTKTAGMNIMGSSWIGGNFWNDYEGSDIDGDGLGDTITPYTSGGNIASGGDYLPLSLNYTPLDTIPSASITNLTNTSYAPNYINWTWSDPADVDFDKVMVYIDGAFQTNVTKGVLFYNASGSAEGTTHTIATRTVDISGNINATWVNQTSKTASAIAKRIITVDDSGGADYMRIQDAINNASAGDTILVYSGIYYENVDVNKQLILQGIDSGSGKPVVDARNIGSSVTLSAGNSTLDGFRATNASGYLQAGIKVNSNNNTIKNNTASNNHDGISLGSSKNNTLNSNTASNNNWDGISLDSSSNNILSSNTISNGYSGINLYSSSNNKLSSNTASNTGFGIILGSSSSNMLSSNTASNNSADGIRLVSSSNNNTLDSNTASNNERNGIILESSSNNMLSSNTVLNNRRNGGTLLSNGIFLDSSSNNTLSGNIASNNRDHGISLDSSSNNTLSGNIASDNSANGIFLGSSSNNTLSDNTASNNYRQGINLIDSSNNTLISNTALKNSYGIILQLSSNNTLSSNTASDNSEDGIISNVGGSNTLSGNTASNNGNNGIYLDYSSNNTLISNTASKNNYGISLESSSKNTIYSNYLNNTNNFRFIGASAGNNWNTTKRAGTNIINGSYTGGNFWAYPNGTGFSQTCMDSNSDGICDTAYVLDANNTDYLPLSLSLTAPTPTPAPDSGGSSGSGGSGVVSSEPTDNIERAATVSKDLHANSEVTYSFPREKEGIYEISINGKENENDVAVRVEHLAGLSRQLKEPAPGDVYYYVNINVGTKKINEASIRFRVENKWLEEQNLNESDVKLVKWDGKKWKKLENKTEKGYYLSLNVIPASSGVLTAEGNYKFNLDIYSGGMGGEFIERGYIFNFVPTQTPQSYSFDTIITGKDESYTFYEATTESFSTFAITGIKSVRADTAAAAGLSGLKTEVTAAPEVTGTITGKAPPVRLIVIFAVTVLVAIAVILYIKKK